MKIKLKGIWATREVWLNGKKLSPAKSQKVWNHSPDGFNWGYGGSGPAQLALAICLELYGTKPANSYGTDTSHFDYQNFKWKYVATLPQSDFDLELDVENPELLDNVKEHGHEAKEFEL